MSPYKVPYKAVTHAFAVAVAAMGTFIATPAGQALIHQYPKLAAIAATLTGIAELYYSPRQA